MPKNGLRRTLIDSVLHAKSLPGLAERVEMYDPAQSVFVQNPGPLKIFPQGLIGWEPAMERKIRLLGICGPNPAKFCR